MDPITMMMIGSLAMQGGGMLSSLLGKSPYQQPNNLGNIAPGQMKSPFIMPDMYNNNDEYSKYEKDPKQSLLGGVDSLAAKMRLRTHPSNLFGQYINF